ncbi:nucleoside deaminase [Streptomyces sp. NBC_01387]|uniref:nucleoside deaminase n=1 Tax=unclassified Streptomyces TaxID=2593676 RepID=UPI0022574AF5|nr:nucleoside deaminase [Streptomyces sp. NBC_01500]MCX4550893.1 nucleoside deaminase [Streptomyces sp. NBC_01500]
MSFAPENSEDRTFLEQAVAISRKALTDEGKTPFGAIVVIGGKTVGTGNSSVMKRNDPTAHAEVMALRSAGSALGRHLMEDGVMYSSSEPCPMCLVACYWARISRLVYAANSHDVGVNGFEDLQFYRELSLPNKDRTLLSEVPVEGDLREQASGALAEWSGQLPFPVVPKL